MPQLDVATYAPQLVWLAITFVLLYVLMARVALPRIGDVLEERTKRREDNLSRAEEMEKEAEKVAEAYEASLAEARTTAHGRIAEAGERAREKAESEITRLDARLGERVREAEAEIDAARSAALGEAVTIAAEAARLAVDKLAGLGIDEAGARAAAAAARKARP